MTPREVILTVGFGCLGITFLIILFSFIGSPYELVERFVEWVKRLRLERATKADKAKKGRHHLNGPDSQDDPQVADHPSDDSAYQDDEKEAA